METLVLSGAHVVDPRDGSIAWGVDVTIVDGVITTVGSASAPATSDVRRIDVSGKFVVPGFNDMHAHALNEKDPTGPLKLMLAYGITGFRQMSGSDALLTARRSGKLPIGSGMPRLLELPADVLSPANGASVEQAVATLRRQVAAGADFVKVAAVSPAVFTALQKAAAEVGTTISGLLPAASDPVVASRYGLRSIEHLGPGISMLAAYPSDETAIRQTLAGAPELKLPPFKIPFMHRIMGALMARIVVNPIQLNSSPAHDPAVRPPSIPRGPRQPVRGCTHYETMALDARQIRREVLTRRTRHTASRIRASAALGADLRR